MSVRTVTFRETGEELRVGKILCLGRNYREHAKEMNAEVPTTPVVFLKPSTALVRSGGKVVLPPFATDMHYEAEMVAVIGKEGHNIARDRAMDHVAGYAVGLDMTLRAVQAEAKKKGLPWSVAKGFDTSAPLSDAVSARTIPNPHALTLSLSVNGIRRQHASTGDMIFALDEIVTYLSSVFTLEPGDLIFTGTPEGVGPVTSGDTLVAELESVGSLTVQIQ